MGIYCWKIIATADPYDEDIVDHIQFAVVHALCSAFVEAISKLEPGCPKRWTLTPIPAGSPHHLDVPTEIADQPRVEFKQLIIKREVSMNDPLLVHIHGKFVTIRTTAQGLEQLTAAIQESCSQGYYRDTFLNIILRIGDGRPSTAQLILWGTDQNNIIYY